MEVGTDSIILFSWKGIHLNATILMTWIVTALLISVSYFATRNLSTGRMVSRWQNFLEAIITVIRKEISNIMRADARPFLPFIGTLFIFISISNLLAVVPLYHPPTSSFSTTSALGVSVLLAAPVYGVSIQGMKGFLKTYLYPVPVMLPFNILSEVTRVTAMAIRLFGNVMSGVLSGAVIISIIPFFFPIILTVLELLIGQIQAYIFSVLSCVIIGGAIRREDEDTKIDTKSEGGYHG